MKNRSDNRLPHLTVLLLFSGMFFFATGCREKQPGTQPGDDPFFKEKNAQFNGDYLATFPLHNPDSCLLRVKNEIPPPLQAWACLSIWYRLPRTSPAVSFRWLELYDQNYPHDTVFAFTQMVRGEFLVEMHKHDSARTVLADARDRYLRLKRPLDASDADYLVGRCYKQENNAAKALETYFRVLDLLNAHDTAFSHRHAYLYFDISTAYASIRDYPQQLFWLKKAWHADYSKLDEPWKYKSKIATRMSTNYAQTNQFDSSLVMARLAADIFRANSKKDLPGELAYRLGFAHVKKGDFATALPILRDAFRRQIDSPNSFMKNQIEQGLAECYFSLEKMDSAAFFFKKALASSDTGNLSAAHHRLAEINARRGNFKVAYEEESTRSTMLGSIFAAEKATAFAQFQAKYETQQKERRIAELEAKQKISQQRNQIFALLLLSFLGFLVSLFLRQRARRRILEQEKQLLEKDKTLLAQEKELAEARETLKTQELERSQTALKKSQRTLKTTKEELDTTARLLMLKNQLLEELEMRLSDQHQSRDAGDIPGSAEHNEMRGMKILTDTDWMRFRERFEQAFPGFLQKLKFQFPALSSAETRLFLLMKLVFDNREIAEALGISQGSVWRSRHRLGKKLGLPETGDLDKFILQFE